MARIEAELVGEINYSKYKASVKGNQRNRKLWAVTIFFRGVPTSMCLRRETGKTSGVRQSC